MDASARVAARFVVATLDVGRGVFTKHLKIHRFHGSVRITDLTNAGKRGKKVRELTVIASTHDEALADKILKQAVGSILDKTYDQAKAALEKVGQEHENLFALHERELRGIDVEPPGTTLTLEKKFEDGSIVRIQSSPHDFGVTNSQLINAPGKAAHGYRQDTLYSPVSKKDGIIFYGWLKDNLSHAANMTMPELRHAWDQMGVKYDYH